MVACVKKPNLSSSFELEKKYTMVEYTFHVDDVVLALLLVVLERPQILPFMKLRRSLQLLNRRNFRCLVDSTPV